MLVNQQYSGKLLFTNLNSMFDFPAVDWIIGDKFKPIVDLCFDFIPCDFISIIFAGKFMQNANYLLSKRIKVKLFY